MRSVAVLSLVLVIENAVSVCVVLVSLAAAATAWADPTDDFIRAQMKQQNIPGIALAVVKDGTIVKAQGYGVADIKTKTAVSPETVFKIASVSKQFIATGIMLLAQDGRLAVGDPIAKYIQGYNVLVEIISRVSGRPWAQFMAERVFKPAGMLATRTTTKEPVANRALGYTDNDNLTEAADWAVVQRHGGPHLDDRVTVILLLNSDDCDDESIAVGVAALHLPDRK